MLCGTLCCLAWRSSLKGFAWLLLPCSYRVCHWSLRAMLAGHGGLQGVNEALEDSQRDGRDVRLSSLCRHKGQTALICRGGVGGGIALHNWAAEMEAVHFNSRNLLMTLLQSIPDMAQVEFMCKYIEHFLFLTFFLAPAKSSFQLRHLTNMWQKWCTHTHPHTQKNLLACMELQPYNYIKGALAFSRD